MSDYIVSARKYRPSDWDSIIGQDGIVQTLQNAIKNDHLAQAFLFCGPRGVGKTTTARVLAKTINQAKNASPNPDEDFAFNVFELDAASNNSVEDIRNLNDQVRIAPQVGEYKVYIIDEVHMLSQAAFNAFLKTLEEPPKHAIFILATTEKHKIIPTILSRCQIFDFQRISIENIVQQLQQIADREGITAEPDALHMIAQKADGGMRDALSIFDQIVSFSGTDLTYQSVITNLNILDYDYYFQLTDLLVANNIPESLVLFANILNKGFDGHLFINGLAAHFRDLLVSQDSSSRTLLDVGENIRRRYFEQAKEAPQTFLLPAIRLCNECDFRYKTSKNQRLLVELTLMQIASLTKEIEKKKS
jgi:DNA polymerase-3 subunit gamma/tau